MKRIISFFQWILTAAAVGFVLLMATAFLPIPGSLKLYTVRSGSMEPVIHTGALIFVHAKPSYNTGDIITIREEASKQTVTHRIVEKKSEGGREVFTTKGDANEEADSESVMRGDIIGKMLFSIPYLGFPIVYAQTKNGFIALIIIPAILIILGEFWTIGKEIVAMWKRRREPPKSEPLAVRVTENSSPLMPLQKKAVVPPRWAVNPEPRKRKIV